jgi:hypothetical protein
MLRRNEIQDPMEAQEVRAVRVKPTDALAIEEVLRRARQIHRQHGGVFGYDFEDWAQAWSELPQNGIQPQLALAGENLPALISEMREGLGPCC